MNARLDNASRVDKQEILLQLDALHQQLVIDSKEIWQLHKDFQYYVNCYCKPGTQTDVLATMMGIFDLFGQSMVYSCHDECFHVTLRSWYECNMTSINEYCDFVKQCIETVRASL